MVTSVNDKHFMNDDTSDAPDISGLVLILGSEEGLARKGARESLVKIGQAAVLPLMKALFSPLEQVRWEAAKALKDIEDPAAAGALVHALEDQSFGVRWLAAEGLVALKRDGLQAVLKRLTERHDSRWLRESAHHVLRLLAQDDEMHHCIRPVLAALDGLEPSITVPMAAWNALHNLAEAVDGQGDH